MFLEVPGQAEAEGEPVRGAGPEPHNHNNISNNKYYEH